MSRNLKLASAMSLVMTATAALALTDVGLAAAAEDEIPDTEIVVDPDLVEESNEQAIVFADPEEVVQEIDPESVEADRLANEAAEEVAEAGSDVVSGAGSLRELVSLQSTSGPLDKEMQCLAATVYFESKGESLAGQLAVARVVMARAESSRFPNSICGVVYQRKQFSFVRNGRMPHINKTGRQWRNAVAIAKIAAADAWKSQVEGALFFHARYVNPGWKLRRIATIDNHIFYR